MFFYFFLFLLSFIPLYTSSIIFFCKFCNLNSMLRRCVRHQFQVHDCHTSENTTVFLNFDFINNNMEITTHHQKSNPNPENNPKTQTFPIPERKPPHPKLATSQILTSSYCKKKKKKAFLVKTAPKALLKLKQKSAKESNKKQDCKIHSKFPRIGCHNYRQEIPTHRIIYTPE